jgi:hypothetical protein
VGEEVREEEEEQSEEGESKDGIEGEREGRRVTERERGRIQGENWVGSGRTCRVEYREVS